MTKIELLKQNANMTLAIISMIECFNKPEMHGCYNEVIGFLEPIIDCKEYKEDYDKLKAKYDLLEQNYLFRKEENNNGKKRRNAKKTKES